MQAVVFFCRPSDRSPPYGGNRQSRGRLTMTAVHEGAAAGRETIP